MDTSAVKECISNLIEKFNRDKHHYLSKDYLEAQTRKDFIDPFFEALGWDISNKAGLAPFEREVLVEKGQTVGRPDYNFCLNGTSKFFVEAKAPSEPLDKVSHILQAKSYAWNTKEVFIVVLTDFEELKLFDASLPPDKRNPLQGLILDLKYTEYLDNLEKLLLLSKEAVSQSSLERLLLKDAKSKRQRIPVDKKFLQDMSLWREELAKDVYKHNHGISVRTLNEVVQRLLDRIVFIRIAEDRKIMPPRTLFEIAQLWKAEGKKRPIQYHLNNLFREINADLNGDIFKSPHACEQYEIDSSLLAGIIEDLYFPNSPYLFDVIGVELLGSIYERYLGSTIRVTPAGRVKVEEKPEVRKAGGVYYTPQYIVKYIVENTVGKLVEGKSPKQIEKIKILDPACGSGSFLLGAFQYLIDYHIKYYREHPRAAHTHPLFPDLLRDAEGNYRLSIIKKGHILRNNIFGVDIDPQAVEVTMMSLYLKALEGERTLPRKQGLLPVLSDNIKCGNSLIGYDIFDQGLLFPDEERERINPFDWRSKSAGFGRIMEKGGFDCVIGNPPWGADVYELEKPYLRTRFELTSGKFESYIFFLEKASALLNKTGTLGFIVPSYWISRSQTEELRKHLCEKLYPVALIVLPENVFADVKMDSCIIVVSKNKMKKILITEIQKKEIAENISTELLQSKCRAVNINDWQNHHTFRFNPRISSKDVPVLTKIESDSSFLGEIVDISQGLTLYRKSTLEEEFGRAKAKEILNHRSFHSDHKKDKTFKKELLGRDVQRYFVDWNQESWVSYGPWLAHAVNERFFKGPRLVIQKLRNPILSQRLVVGYLDDDETYSAGVLLNAILKGVQNYHLYYIMGLLDSRALNYWYRKCILDVSIRVVDLKRVPIRTIDFNNPKEKAMHDRLIGLVERMLELNKKRHALPASSQREAIEREIAVTDEKIDDLVYGLYGITDKERKIIEGSA